ncbi:hypothetical protein [Streptomyces sviceus]|uniref:hypothetical protein n=1 Tax=Streptomyces sviceus TaxID=285530 RepID=UPI0036CD7B1B
MDELAAVVARAVPAGAGVVPYTENGMINTAPKAGGDAVEPDLTNAGKVPVIELPTAACLVRRRRSSG